MTAIYKPTKARGFAYEERGQWFFTISLTGRIGWSEYIRCKRSDLVLIPEVR